MNDFAPEILPQGVDGMILRVSAVLDDASNRYAVALADCLRGVAGVLETAPSLGSVYVRFDPAVGRAAVTAAVRAVPVPAQATDAGRLWEIPCVYDGPQLAEAASLAGLTSAQAVAELSNQEVRVLAIGFAPGQPYLGILPEHWNLPRLSGLTPQVPAGALVVAVRQLVLFANASPTGWRMVGRTGFRCFDPAARDHIGLQAGDRIRFPVADAAAISQPNGGARLV